MMGLGFLSLAYAELSRPPAADADLSLTAPRVARERSPRQVDRPAPSEVGHASKCFQ